nr:MAG TPA: hypothetical protein [Caudoviricetes sp.]
MRIAHCGLFCGLHKKRLKLFSIFQKLKKKISS